MQMKKWQEEFSRTVARSPSLWLLLIVAAYLFCALNVDLAANLSWHDGQRMAQLALLALGVTVFLALPGISSSVISAWHCMNQPAMLALTGLFLLGVLSGLLSALPRWAFLELGMVIMLGTLALMVAVARAEAGEFADSVLLTCIFFTALAYAVKTAVVYGAMLAIGPGYGMSFDVRDLYTGFSNIRFFGHVQTMLLPLLMLPVMWWAKNWRQRLVLGLVPVIWWILVIGSGTRGTWVALSIGIVAVLIFGGAAGRTWLKWQLVVIGGGGAGYAMLTMAVPATVGMPAAITDQIRSMVSLSRREEIWGAALEHAERFPWFGIGPMHFAQYPNTVAAHPHNVILQFMAEWGIPAALLATFVLAAGGWAWAKQVRSAAAAEPHARKSLLAVALLAALAGAAAQSMVDGVIVMPVSQILLVLVAGWAMGLYIQSKRPPLSAASAGAKLLALLLVLSAAGAVVQGVAPDILEVGQREQAYLKTRPPGEILFPRFWAQGWINK